MIVTFVDDEDDATVETRDILRKTTYFEIREPQFKSYNMLTDDVIELTDLFVLDVLIAGSTDQFELFIKRLRRVGKPFVAFSRLTGTRRLSKDLNEPSLRQIIFEHGGLAHVYKEIPPEKAGQSLHQSVTLDLVQNIIAFYWSRKGR